MKTNNKPATSDELTTGRYSMTAIVLHWLLALVILGVFAVGIYSSDLPISPQRLKLINYHKWAGICFLALTAFRIVWRLKHRPPALPASIELAMPNWQSKAYHATHFVLYALFLGVPLLGWAYSSAAGFPVVVFGVIPLPDFMAVDKEFAKQIRQLLPLRLSVWQACISLLQPNTISMTTTV
jgi:cytochrome b561